MYKTSFSFLLCWILTIFATHASQEVPSVFIRNYTVDDYKASCQNWDISISPNGTLYVANNLGLLTFDGNTWKTYLLPDNSNLTSVTFLNDTIYTQGESTLGFWTLEKSGILQYHPLDSCPSKINFRTLPDSPPFTIPEEIKKATPTAYASIGELNFTGTQTAGLYITNPQGEILLHLSMQNQLQDNLVRSICIQDTEQIWVAFDNGLCEISLNPPIRLIAKRSHIGKLLATGLNSNDLYIQTNIGYFKRPLSEGFPFTPISEEETSRYIIFDNQEDTSLSANTFFSNPEALGIFVNAKQIYPSDKNHYWLSINNEIGLFQRENKEATLKCRILLDNYKLNLVTRGKSIFPLNDSLHLISTMQGILLINTRKLIESGLGGTTLPGFTKIEYTDDSGIHDLPISTKKISLPHDFKDLNVYVGTTIFTPNHQISYKLEGVSSDWSPWQREGKISLLQLPEGKYDLKIRKYVIKGPFPEITMNIEVRPPWYNSIWAYLGYLAIIWLIVQEGLRYYLKSLRKEEQETQKAEQQIEEQRLQQLKNEMLETELQNKNNELTLQTSALVKRNQSIQTLLEELEQQKEALGTRYPTKFYTRMRTLMEETLNDQADWLQFESYFSSAHQNFIERLRQQYSDLTTGDFRICCLLRMNLSTKEIASLMNISVRAVELRRYRLRKRMMLDGDTNLVDFLMNL